MKTDNSFFKFSALALSVTGIALSGCSDSNDSISTGSPDAENESFSEIQIDASSYTDTTYFNLLSGTTVELGESEAASSTAWHIGFTRTALKLNGGDSGPGNVAGALADTQEDYYNGDEADVNVFLNSTKEDEENALLASYDLSSLSFVTDELQAAIQGSGDTIGTTSDQGWYNYDFASHQTSLNDENWWLLKSNTGLSYAKFHATDFSYSSESGLNVTFSFDVQAEGTEQFAGTATFDTQVDATGGSECFDFDTDLIVDCNSDDWDLKLEIAGRSWNLWTNGGDSGEGNGGAFGPFTTEDADAYSAGHLAPDGVTSIARHYTSDASAGVFSENSWYAYNLENGHKLWPNYRTYIIDTDTSDENSIKYAFQIVNYYSDADVSGNPTIRFVEIESTED